MRKTAIRGVILQKITEYYCATGTATTVKQLAIETGFRPQNINRMVKSMAKAKQLTIIGGYKRRQVKFLLPMNALIAPGFFRLAPKDTKHDKYLRPDEVQIGIVAIQLKSFFERNIQMASLGNTYAKWKMNRV
ncbi:hypothetical protein [Turneriella parva]|uniref:Uncharacterized protein n=1 Tax=Turneriella parva (strain ATCC BAA-1111 / DSM 21527 / NCTC 11395 / H) TaxID=869212 RepID=I4B1P5_TURPD|nr:hypothetical protein [Turneriella parva]AFM11202.1 hypothetical protein Turpa_0549 [Turneriella parva DSM 21527]